MIGILSRLMNTYSNKLLKAELEEQEEIWIHIKPSELVPYISSNLNGYDYLEEFATGNKIKRPKSLIWRGGGSGEMGANVHSQLICMGVSSTHSPIGISCVSNKALAHQLMSAAGVKNPKTRIVPTVYGDDWEKFYKRIGKGNKGRVIIKALRGSQGNNVWYCPNIAKAREKIAELIKEKEDKDKKLKGPFLFQQYIPTEDEDGRVSDIRVIIVNGEIVVAMKRKSGENSENKLANISQGGKGEKVTLSKEQEDICLRAAEACDMLYSVCGVDIVTDKDDETYVLELNSNIGLKAQEYTGVNICEKILEFAKELQEDPIEMMARNIMFSNSLDFAVFSAYNKALREYDDYDLIYDSEQYKNRLSSKNPTTAQLNYLHNKLKNNKAFRRFF